MKKHCTPLNAADFKPKTLVLAVKKALPYLVALSLGAAVVSPAVGRSGDSAAAFTATQLIRQFTLKNTVAQVSQGMQGSVQEVNGVLRAVGMGGAPSGYPVDMGSVPSSANLPQRDGAGRPLGYCAWDNSSSASNASFLAGLGTPSPLVYAVVSPGLNGSMETSCAHILSTRTGLGDDYVQVTAPSQTSSRQFRSAVGTYADLAGMPADEGDIRLVLENNRLYSYVGGAWQPVDGSRFSDDSANNGVGAIAYTTGKVTVADFQATSATISGELAGSTATFSSSVTANSFVGNGAGLTDLNASNISSGVLGAAFGGTGVDSTAAAQGSLLIGTGAGFALGAITAGNGIDVVNGAGSIMISNTGVLSIAGTNNQIVASAMNGDVLLSLPQDIATTSSPTFNGLMLGGVLNGSAGIFSGDLTARRLIISDFTGGVTFANTVIGLGAMNGMPSGNGANTAVGQSALSQNSSGEYNVAVGSSALRGNTTGSRNVAVGTNALMSSTTGSNNAAFGNEALRNNTTGYFNQAVGSESLLSNTTGHSNIAIGQSALRSNTEGRENQAIGRDALYRNSSGYANQALGAYALYENTTGYNNTAIGYVALASNRTGSENAAVGRNALGSNTSGQANTVVGYAAGLTNTTGSNNTLLGHSANVVTNNLSYATALGSNAVVSTSNTIALGRTTDTTVIGATGTATGGILQNKILQVTGDVGISGALSIGGTFTATAFSGNGNGLTDLNAGNINSGTLGIAFGGTGVDGSAAANGSLLIGNGTGYTLANLTAGTGVSVTNGAGSITISNAGVTSFNTRTGDVIFTRGDLNGVIESSDTFNLSIGTSSAAITAGGDDNIAIGRFSQNIRASGFNNTSVGSSALRAITLGNSNAAFGAYSLSSATNNRNSAFGNSALRALTSGNDNTAVGNGAGYMTASGVSTNATTTGSNNTFLGANAMAGTTTQLTYATALGASSQITTNDTIVLGRTSDVTVIGATGDDGSGNKLQVTGGIKSTGTVTANAFVGNGSGLTNLDTADFTTGILSTARGGTGVDGSAAANGALLIGNSTGYTLANLTAGTGVSVTNGAGSITIANTGVTSFNGRTNAVVLELDDINSAISSSGGYRIGGSTMSRNTTGYENIAFGFGNLDYNTTGSQNVAIGHQSMTSHSPTGSTAVGYFAHSSGNGSFNSAFGRFTLLSLNGGSYNTALGNEALRDVSSGSYNTGSGSQAGLAVTTGSYNTFIGYQSNLSDATQRTFATAIGAQAVVGSDNTIVLGRTNDTTVIGATGTASSGILQNKKLQVTGDVGVLGAISLDGTLAGTTGTFNGALTASRFLFSNTSTNIAIGDYVLSDLESGFGNIGIGNFVLFENVSGSNNIAIGDGSQSCNETGIRNVAVGYETLNCLISGDHNTAIGTSALYSTDGFGNTGVGGAALASNYTGNENTGLGYYAGIMRDDTGSERQRYGSNNTFLGAYSHPVTDTLFYATAIGSNAGVSTDNTVALGRAVEDSVVIGATGTASSGILQNKKLQVTGDVGISGSLAIGGTFTAAGFSGNGSGLTDLNASNISTGSLGTAFGGTGVNGSAASNGALLIGNGTGYTLANLTAGAGVSVTNGAGSITIANTGVTSFNARTGAVTLTGADVASAVTKGVANTAVGSEAMGFITTGFYNTAFGTWALKSTTTGHSNSAFGVDALEFASGSNNTAVGRAALRGSSGDDNTAIGQSALESNGSGASNVAIGRRAGFTNSTGSNNTFLGRDSDAGSAGLSYATALGASSQVTTNNTIVLGRSSDTTVIGATGTATSGILQNKILQVTGDVGFSGRLDVGTIYAAGQEIKPLTRNNIQTALVQGLAPYNSVLGDGALRENSTGERNTAFGHHTGYYISTGSANTAVGAQALAITSSGYGNTSVGDSAGYQITTGFNNSTLGFQAGYLIEAGTNNTILGANADVLAGSALSFSTAIGAGSLVSTSNTIALGRNGTTDQVVIGAASRTGTHKLYVDGTALVTGGVTTSSDARLKTNIQQLDNDSMLEKLGLISAYRYNYIHTPQAGKKVGVLAQEIQTLFPEVANYGNGDQFLSVDYSALGAMAAVGVGQLNTKFKALSTQVDEQGNLITALDEKVGKVDIRVAGLETWKTEAMGRMDGMQNAIELNIQEIAKNTVAIQTNSIAIERLDDALFTLDGRVKNNSDLINNINARWARNFSESEDGSVLAVNAVELKVSNFTAQQLRANSVYSQRLEAEMARIADLEVNNLRANSAVANTVQAEQVNTGSAQVYAGVGLPAVLFAAKSDGHYTVSTSALDGSYATATVIVNAGQAKVVSVASEGIGLYAEGNQVKVIAAGKSIKASWIKMG